MLSDPFQPPILADTVIRHIGQLVTLAQQPLPHASGSLKVISNAALAVHNGRISWIGSDDEATPLFLGTSTRPTQDITTIDACGAVVTPGLVDSHTHLLFAGDRAEEFHLRRKGITY